MNYSIWIIPPTPVKSTLSEVIKNLAEEFNGPVFEPHMTILGNIKIELPIIINGLQEVAKNLTKLNLSLGPASFSTTYFQNALVRVNSTAELMRLNIDLKNKFNLANDVFMPHISLLYGEQDMRTREVATSKIPNLESEFNIEEFIVTPSRPNPDEWVHSAVIPFGGK